MNDKYRDELVIFIKETIDNNGAYNCETEEITLDNNGFDHVAENIADYVGDIRKETAREYYKAMREVIHKRDYISGYAEIGLQEENDEIAKRFGVEVEE